MNKILCNLLLFLAFTQSLWAQIKPDSLKSFQSKEIEIIHQSAFPNRDKMPDLKENVIYAGKKSEVILMENSPADLSTNQARQVFAKVPGLNVWENDGSGVQVGVSARGLSPNRSWEFNVRQNGYDISSEVFGYPEAYFSPPMDALERIEVVRGAASLQFGPQFGGLLNYQIKKGHATKPIHFETQQTVGNYGLFNSYNALGGTIKNVSYYTYLHHRAADGWRQNSRFSTWTGYASVNWQISQRFSIQGEYTRMDYSCQQAGGLTDAQFASNPSQSSRARNWFGAPWNVAALTLKFQMNETTQLQLRTFGTFSERNSVGFLGSITQKDTINAATLQYNARQVDRDEYRNVGTEARISSRYSILGKEQVISGGIRAYRGQTNRFQQGKGTTGSDFDLTVAGDFGRSLEFTTYNYAAFAEHLIHLGQRWKLVPGIRFEYLENEANGRISTQASGVLTPQSQSRQVFLYGLGAEYQLANTLQIYGNYSRSFRPVTFSELTPSATTEVIDPNLKDASGFNADLGIRGSVGNFLTMDIGVFYLHYDNRIGTITRDGNPFKTNIGTSVSQGVESYVEFNPMRCFFEGAGLGSLSLFSSNSLINARYTRWDNPALAGDPTKSIENKRVENAPQYIHRVGATYGYKCFSASFQLSATGEVYTDAANTKTANAAGTVGMLSAYEVMDASMQIRCTERFNVKAGVNNLTDAAYATRRAGGYPGPGILPGNGRTFFVTLSAGI